MVKYFLNAPFLLLEKQKYIKVVNSELNSYISTVYIKNCHIDIATVIFNNKITFYKC